MSSSSYLIAIPAFLVAISAWLVSKEDWSFFQPRRTLEIQRLARHSPIVPAPLNATREAHLEYERTRDAMPSTLGNDLPVREIGARPGKPRDWLTEPVPIPAAAGAELSPIPDYVAQALVPDPALEPVASESGFHITSDEVSKLGANTNKLHFKGSVHVTSPQFNLSGDELLVRLGKDEAIDTADATGHVHVRLVNLPPEKTFRAESQAAQYDPKAGKLILTGWPKVRGQEREIIAAEESARIILYPQTGKLVTEGRTQTRVAKALMEAAKSAPPKKTTTSR